MGIKCIKYNDLYRNDDCYCGARAVYIPAQAIAAILLIIARTACRNYPAGFHMICAAMVFETIAIIALIARGIQMCSHRCPSCDKEE
jgi:hypothetical protein